MANTELLCWGGPEHGKVYPIDKKHTHGPFKFPVKQKPSVRYADALVTSPSMMVPTVTYSIRRISLFGTLWTALIYSENEDRLYTNLETHLVFFVWWSDWGLYDLVVFGLGDNNV